LEIYIANSALLRVSVWTADDKLTRRFGSRTKGDAFTNDQ